MRKGAQWSDVTAGSETAGSEMMRAAMAYKTSATEPLMAELKSYQDRGMENAVRESEANTGAFIEQIRAGKTPEKSGFYNSGKLSDASYEYKKYQTAQAFKQRAEARAIAAAGRSAAAHKARMAGLTAKKAGKGTVVPAAIGGAGGSIDWGTALDKALAPKTQTAEAAPVGKSEDQMIKKISSGEPIDPYAGYVPKAPVVENFMPDISNIPQGDAPVSNTSMLDSLVDKGAVPTTIAEDNAAAAEESLMAEQIAQETIARDDAFSRVIRNKNTTPAGSYLSEDNGMRLPMIEGAEPTPLDPNAENVRLAENEASALESVLGRDAEFRASMPESPTGSYPEVPYTGSADNRADQMERDLISGMDGGPDNYSPVDPHPNGEDAFLRQIEDNQSRKEFRDSLPADLKTSQNQTYAEEGDLYRDTKSLITPATPGDDIPGKMLENKIAEQTRAEAKVESEKNVANKKAMTEFKKTMAENKKRNEYKTPAVRKAGEIKAEETLVKRVKEANVKAVKSTNVANLNTFMSGQKLVQKAETENKKLAAKGKPQKKLDPYLQTIQEWGNNVKKTNAEYNTAKDAIARFEKQGRALINKHYKYNGTAKSKYANDIETKKLEKILDLKNERVDKKYSIAVKASEAEKAGFAVLKAQFEQRQAVANKKLGDKDESADMDLLNKEGVNTKTSDLKTIAGKKDLRAMKKEKKAAKTAFKAGNRKDLYANLSGLGGAERTNVDRVVRSLDKAGIKGGGDSYLRFQDEYFPYGVSFAAVADAPDTKDDARAQLIKFMEQNEYTIDQQDKALDMFDKDNDE